MSLTYTYIFYFIKITCSSIKDKKYYVRNIWLSMSIPWIRWIENARESVDVIAWMYLDDSS